MKNKFLLLLTFFVFALKANAQLSGSSAQAIPQDTVSLYQMSSDSLFQNLDKSAITTNVLYDRVAQFADLDTLSGLINNSTNPAITTSSEHFMQAWKELYDASYSH